VASSDGELQDLRRLVAELTARVFRLENALNLQRGNVVEASAAPKATAQITEQKTAEHKPTPPLTIAPLIAPTPVPLSRPSSSDLESRIGSHWLNRIGITAVLIGVSYFLKFAFDNDWIGPTGRVAIGLLAGIAVVVWSETFRRRFLFLEGGRHRGPLPLAVRCISGLQPDTQ